VNSSIIKSTNTAGRQKRFIVPIISDNPYPAQHLVSQPRVTHKIKIIIYSPSALEVDSGAMAEFNWMRPYYEWAVAWLFSNNWPQRITVTKDVIVGVAAIVASVVAVKGLSTWRRQLRGEIDYNLARRLLQIAYRYRDAIDGVRNPVMVLSTEMPAPPEEKARTMSAEQILFYGRSKAYENRWDRVVQARALLYPELLEAEALWENEKIRDCFAALLLLEHELYRGVQKQMQLESPDVSVEKKEAVRDRFQGKRDVIFSSETDDLYGKEFHDQVEKIAAKLRGHLQR
jgi:hypothetical protein